MGDIFRQFLYRTGIIILFIILSLPLHLHSDDYDKELKSLLRLIVKPPVEVLPKYDMYSKNEIIYCRGDTDVARANNRVAGMMENGDYIGAEGVLKEAIGHASLFFPFRYNLGLCYIYLDNTKIAQINLIKASQVFPEYSKTYLQIGYTFQRQGRDQDAIYFYRKALEKNSGELKAFILIGDIYFNRKQYEMAMKYYEASLKIDRRLPDGLIGLAKIYFKREKYFMAVNTLNTVDISGEYDKSFHYYYAECSYNLRDYVSAFKHYNELLKYRYDKFFLTHSITIIRHKLELTRRFVER